MTVTSNPSNQPAPLKDVLYDLLLAGLRERQEDAADLMRLRCELLKPLLPPGIQG